MSQQQQQQQQQQPDPAVKTNGSGGKPASASALASSMGEASAALVEANAARAVRNLQDLQLHERSRRTVIRHRIHGLLAQHRTFDARSPESFAMLSKLLREMRDEESGVSHPRVEAGVQFILHCCAPPATERPSGQPQQSTLTLSLKPSGPSQPASNSGAAASWRKQTVPLRLQVYANVLDDAVKGLKASIADERVTVQSIARLLVKIEQARGRATADAAAGGGAAAAAAAAVGSSSAATALLGASFESSLTDFKGIWESVTSKFKELLGRMGRVTTAAESDESGKTLVAVLQICRPLVVGSSLRAGGGSNSSSGGGGGGGGGGGSENDMFLEILAQVCVRVCVCVIFYSSSW